MTITYKKLVFKSPETYQSWLEAKSRAGKLGGANSRKNDPPGASRGGRKKKTKLPIDNNKK